MLRAVLARSFGGLARSAAAASAARLPLSRSLHHDGGEFDAGSQVLYPPVEAAVGQLAPGFAAKAVVGGEIVPFDSESLLGKWSVLFFYPKDFTFVCPTEIIAFSDRAAEFEALNCQLVAASTDTEETHLAWVRTPRKKGGLGHMQIPLVADTTKSMSARYGVLLEELGIALRGLFIINPEGVIEQITINNLPVGRSVDETLRLIKGFQFVAEHGEVCPADWTPGQATMVPTTDGSASYFSSGATESDQTEDFLTALQPIASKAEYEALVASGKPLVVDFYADYCAKCRQIAPTIEALVAEHPGVTFAKFDTQAEALQELKEELDISVLPTFKFYKGGKEAHPAVTGYKKKPIAEAVAAIAA